LVKDSELRDNPHALPSDSRDIRLLGQQPVYSGNGEGVHQILRDWRELAEGYRQPRLLLGETMVYTAKRLAMFYGHDDELQLGFDFPFWQAPFRSSALRRIVAEVEAALPEGAWPAWAASNHDIARAASRWAHGNEAKARLALTMILTLRGTPVLYYGEELGMTDTHVPRWRYRDEAGKRFWPLFAGRDRERTPMVWDDSEAAGFTKPGVTPWLPIGSRRRNVENQRGKPDSTLDLTRRLIALRQSSDDLRRGDYRDMSRDKRVWAYQRGEATIVILNMSSRAVTFGTAPARQRFSTRGALAHLRGTAHSQWQLAPWEGIILSLNKKVDKA
jgi:alpha-glucosidase